MLKAEQPQTVEAGMPSHACFIEKRVFSMLADAESIIRTRWRRSWKATSDDVSLDNHAGIR